MAGHGGGDKMNITFNKNMWRAVLDNSRYYRYMIWKVRDEMEA